MVEGEGRDETLPGKPPAEAIDDSNMVLVGDVACGMASLLVTWISSTRQR